jgi:SM-20-related protein
MPAAEFFERLGLFVRRGFLDAEECARLSAEARQAERVAGAVGDDEESYAVDVRRRSTDIAEVPAEAKDLVDRKLTAMIPEIERHFSVAVEGRQSLQFLAYKKGDFFQAHRDRNEAPEVADYAGSRQVSVAIFLNGEGEESSSGTYGGGSLTFYGLLGEDDADRQIGLPLIGEEGLLVAFRSDLAHAVTPVTHGERYTVVTWFV